MKSHLLLTFALCLACFNLASGLRAQTYTPVPYNFGSVFEVTDGSGGDSATDLSMDCLASDGYGQWTCSYKTRNHFDSGSPGLFLLANALRSPSGNTETGIVSFRPFVLSDSIGYPVDGSATNRSIVKCVDNLKGRVRWVWPAADHKSFIVQGFDECKANGDSGLTGINLEFASYPYNTTYGSADSLRRLGKDVIKMRFPTAINTLGPLLSHPVVSAAYEANPYDWFAIAMDTTNLYIVWEEYDSLGHYNIWEETLCLATGYFNPSPYLVVAGGRRPSVAAEIRRQLVVDTSSRGCFDVSYTTGLLSMDHLTWFNYDGARILHPADTMVMTKLCQDTAGGIWPYMKVLHTCMLDATWESITSSDTTPRAIYTIVTDMTDTVHNIHLIMHKIKGGVQDATAYYCDGTKIKYHSVGVDDGNFPVIDKPIRAFVNPYDGEKNSNFDEYHCMYQLARTYSGGSHRPLMIIHGAMVSDTLGPKVCLNFAASFGTVIYRPDPTHIFFADPGLNTDGGDTDNYVGAVNQMGIQCHWRNDSAHYYLRDRRKFDEDIEENTLGTDNLYIADGTSHGGTIGALVLPGKTMTLWEDTCLPYWHHGYCDLNFPSTGTNMNTTELTIGTGSGSPAKLVAVQEYWMQCYAPTQYIHIKANSTFEMEGVDEQLDYSIGGLGNSYGGIWLDGSGASMTGGAHGWPASISNPATLNMHGGSDLELGDSTSFICSNGIVNILKDQLFNVNSDSAGSAWSFQTEGSCVIDSSIFVREDTSYSLAGEPQGDLFEINNRSYNSLDTIKIINSYFRGGDVEMGELQVDIGFPPLLPVMVSGGKFVNASIYACPIPFGATFQNLLFDSVTFHYGFDSLLYNFGLGLNMYFANSYDFITTQNCNFLRLDNGVDGIKVTSFENDSNIMEHIHILNDTFNYVSGTTPHAAIELDNSEGFIQGNDIEGNFDYGIYVTGGGGTTGTAHTGSLICTNLITGSAGGIAGIYTDNTQGYCKMNSVTVSGTGHISGPNDLAHIIFSLYNGSGGNGLSVTDPSAAPDLSGVHSDFLHPHDEDYAAFDTIEGNASHGVAQITLVKGAKIYLGYGLEVPSAWHWSDWSRNNIVGLDGYGACGGSIIYDVPLIIVDSGHSHSTDLKNISRNFFGVSTILPEHDTVHGIYDTFGTPSSWQVGVYSDTLANGFIYNADSNNFTVWQNRIPGLIECEESLPVVRPKGEVPQSIQADTSCDDKYAMGVGLIDNNDDLPLAYEILQSYIETCYNTPQAWHAFVDLNISVQGMSTDPSRYENYREWLKSVLWLNQTDPEWYCACVRSILFSYRWDSTANGLDYNAGQAVEYYVESTHRCPDDSSYFAIGDSANRAAQRQLWLDTVNQLHHGDTKDFPEDTTVPTLQQIGMEILIGPPASVDTSSSPQTGIGALIASENPFTKETTVSFSMGEYAYISFQVFDVLGTVVEGDYKGTVIGPGEHSFTVDGANWAAGTYYARITTPIGETRMIKLVKE